MPWGDQNYDDEPPPGGWFGRVLPYASPVAVIGCTVLNTAPYAQRWAEALIVLAGAALLTCFAMAIEGPTNRKR